MCRDGVGWLVSSGREGGWFSLALWLGMAGWRGLVWLLLEKPDV